MIPVAEALAQVLAGVTTLPAEEIAVSDALGRVLAEDVSSRITQPPVAVTGIGSPPTNRL